MNTFVALFLLLAAAAARAGDFAAEFAFVMIDDETEARFGPFPYDRKLYAEALDACANNGAKAVVLKFFLDQERSSAGDALLRESMGRIPVALQARLDAEGGTSSIIPAKFGFAAGRIATSERGDRGWIPLPIFLENAAAVGFVDFNTAVIPLFEEYQDAAYKSLIISCLELAIEAPARISAAGRVYVGSGYLPTDGTGGYRAEWHLQGPMKTLSFGRLLAGEVKRAELEGRVVIIGWDSASTPTLATEHGKVGIHCFFLQCLAASYLALQANSEPLSP